MAANELYTLGHSRHTAQRLVELLRCRHITLLADVRSHPASKYSPQFGKAALAGTLRSHGIEYVFLGAELGGRPQGAQYYGADGSLDCERRAAAPDFLAGIQRLVALAREQQSVMLCAEEDPLHCHRRRLITPAVLRAGLDVLHLRGDGRSEHDSALAPPQLALFR